MTARITRTMSNQTTTATERNAFDIALQYATGIKIGADWREIAMTLIDDSSSGMVVTGADDVIFVGCCGYPGDCRVVSANNVATCVSVFGGCMTDDVDISFPFVVVKTDGAVREYSGGPVDLAHSDFAGGAAIVPGDWWEEALRFDARLHRKPSWRERASAAHNAVFDDVSDRVRAATFPPLVEGTVRSITENTITVGDSGDAATDEAEESE